MSPKIGITASIVDGKLILKEQYIRAAMEAGAVPLAVPPLADERILDQYIAELDGWIVSGGADVDPSQYGEEPLPELGPVLPERDLFEIGLIRKAAAKDVPILAVCRGMQVLNVAFGGSLYQDVRYFRGDHLQHQQKAAYPVATHTVDIVPGSRLHRIAGKNQIRTNSMHHQAAKTIGSGLSVSARALDGIVEAIESASHRFVLGVQWHPEEMAGFDEDAKKLFRAWIEACKEGRKTIA